MAIQVISTRNVVNENGINMLVYGQSGVGKTHLCGTWKNKDTLILSAEGGLLTLHGKDVAAIEIRSMNDLLEVFDFLNNEKGEIYDLICFDSITEMAEVCLADEMTKTKDGRKAYGELGNIMTKLIRAFRDLQGKHILMIAQADKVKDEATGALVYSPSAPGKKLAHGLPFFFDIVMALRVETSEDGTTHRYMQTQSDGQWLAKDRSGKLEMYEDANLTNIISKTGGTND